jgi:hypothetical protein
MADRPSHVAEQPWGPASTDFTLQIPCYCLLESDTMKPTHKGQQSWADRPPPMPTGPRPLHTASSCEVHSRGDTYFGGIPIFFVIS